MGVWGLQNPILLRRWAQEKRDRARLLGLLGLAVLSLMLLSLRDGGLGLYLPSIIGGEHAFAQLILLIMAGGGLREEAEHRKQELIRLTALTPAQEVWGHLLARFLGTLLPALFFGAQLLWLGQGSAAAWAQVFTLLMIPALLPPLSLLVSNFSNPILRWGLSGLLLWVFWPVSRALPTSGEGLAQGFAGGLLKAGVFEAAILLILLWVLTLRFLAESLEPRARSGSSRRLDPLLGIDVAVLGLVFWVCRGGILGAASADAWPALSPQLGCLLLGIWLVDQMYRITSAQNRGRTETWPLLGRFFGLMLLGFGWAFWLWRGDGAGDALPQIAKLLWLLPLVLVALAVNPSRWREGLPLSPEMAVLLALGGGLLLSLGASGYLGGRLVFLPGRGEKFFALALPLLLSPFLAWLVLWRTRRLAQSVAGIATALAPDATGSSSRNPASPSAGSKLFSRSDRWPPLLMHDLRTLFRIPGLRLAFGGSTLLLAWLLYQDKLQGGAPSALLLILAVVLLSSFFAIGEARKDRKLELGLLSRPAWHWVLSAWLSHLGLLALLGALWMFALLLSASSSESSLTALGDALKNLLFFGLLGSALALMAGSFARRGTRFVVALLIFFLHGVVTIMLRGFARFDVGDWLWMLAMIWMALEVAADQISLRESALRKRILGVLALIGAWLTAQHGDPLPYLAAGLALWVAVDAVWETETEFQAIPISVIGLGIFHRRGWRSGSVYALVICAGLAFVVADDAFQSFGGILAIAMVPACLDRGLRPYRGPGLLGAFMPGVVIGVVGVQNLLVAFGMLVQKSLDLAPLLWPWGLYFERPLSVEMIGIHALLGLLAFFGLQKLGYRAAKLRRIKGLALPPVQKPLARFHAFYGRARREPAG